MVLKFAAARCTHTAIAFALAALIAAPAFAQDDREDACAPFWEGDFGMPGADASVRAFIVYNDGSEAGPCLYVGGTFNAIGGVPANFIARWNGREWSPLGEGVNAAVRSFAIFDEGSGAGPVLFVGGNFTFAGGVSANGIARFDGTSWSPVSSASDGAPNGVNGSVASMTVLDDGSGMGAVLFVGGYFTEAEGAPAKNVARWDGEQWSAIGAGLDATVFTLASFNGGGNGVELYAGGWFTHSGSVDVSRIAKWNGVAWGPVGKGVDSGVHALAVWDDGLGGGPALYAGGFFANAGDVAVRNMAKWDGAIWGALPLELAGAVQSLTVHNDGTGGGTVLYAGGNFYIPVGTQFPYAGVAKWDGALWSLLAGGTDNMVLSVYGAEGISPVGNGLYIGGDFNSIGGVPANALARWKGCLETQPCAPEDFNCDGLVDGNDLGTMLGSWGECHECATDLNGDGSVDGNDLGSLLGAWSP